MLSRYHVSLGKLIEELGGPPARGLTPALTPEQVQVIPFLPSPFEKMLVKASLSGEISQKEIGQKYGISQPAVSYRLHRAIERLEFLSKFPRLPRARMLTLLRSAGLEKDDVSMMVCLYKTTCQSSAAKELGIPPGRVRYRLNRTVTHLEKLVSEGRSDLDSILTALRMIRDNAAILHPLPPPRACSSQAV